MAFRSALRGVPFANRYATEGVPYSAGEPDTPNGTVNQAGAATAAARFCSCSLSQRARRTQ